MYSAKLPAALLWAVLALLPGCSDGSDGARPPNTVSVANINLLHGFDCDPPVPADGDQCRVRERVDLLREFLLARDCPDIVTLQEIINQEFAASSPTVTSGPLDSLVELLDEATLALEEDCGFRYRMVYEPFLEQVVAQIDEEVILSRYPVTDTGLRVLHSALYDVINGYRIFARHALHARIDHPAGAVDVYTTHLASGSDDATNDCDSFSELVAGTGIGPRVSCPAECDPSDTVRACQAEQLALFVEATRGPDNLALITGDFNAQPGSSEYRSMTRRGWIDTHLAGGQPECDSATGIGCTSGRGSSAEALENPALNTQRRIDYIFAALPPTENHCRVYGDTAARADGHYRLAEASLFAAVPNPFAGPCGSPPLPMCWVSDHSGNFASLACAP